MTPAKLRESLITNCNNISITSNGQYKFLRYIIYRDDLLSLSRLIRCSAPVSDEVLEDVKC